MSDKDDIYKRIQESFEEQNKATPEGLWKNINEGLNTSGAKELDNKLKESFEGAKVVAPNHVWEEMNKQLNIDRAWNKIKRILDRRTAGRRRRRVAVLFLLLLLCGWGSYVYLNTGERTGQEAIVLKNRQQTNVEKNEVEKKEIQNTLKTNDWHKNNISPGAEKNQSITQSIENIANSATGGSLVKKEKVSSKVNHQLASNNKKEVLAQHKHSKANIEKLPQNSNAKTLQKIPRIDTYNIARDMQSKQALSKLVEIDSFPKIVVDDVKRYELGAMFTYGKTWIYNNETRISKDPSSWVKSNGVFEPGFGITGNYNFSAKHSITSSFFFDSHYKQQYQTYIDGHYAKKQIELHYSKLLLNYQYNILPKGAISFSRYVINAGPYIGLMKKAEHTTDGIGISSESNYTNIDYGATMRIGQELMKGNLIIGYGVKGEIGLTNVFNGNEITPADFDYTTLYMIGGYTVLKYRF